MAMHSNILAWRIPWTEEPGGRYSPWDCKEVDMPERLTLSFFISMGYINSATHLFIQQIFIKCVPTMILGTWGLLVNENKTKFHDFMELIF